MLLRTLALLILLCCYPKIVIAQTDPAWSPAMSQRTYLAPEMHLLHFAICPPTDFTLVETTSFGSGRKEYRFLGIRRNNDGSVPTLIVTAEVGEKAGANWTVDAGMQVLLQTQDQILTLDKMTDIQHGTVSGFPALRSYGKGNALVNVHFDGLGINHHRPAHVILYGIGDSRLSAVALAIDYEPLTGPYDPQILLRMEAAMQTLRLTDPPPPPPAPMKALFPGQWLPRADLLPFLLKETVINGVAIRPPQEFDPITLTLGEGKTPALFGFGWQSRRSQALLRFLVEPLPPGETPRSLAALMTDIAAAEGKGQKNYSHSEIEYGVTGLGTSGRFTGTGTLPLAGSAAGTPRTCTVYGIVTPTQFIRIEALTSDPPGSSVMDLMAASLLTGRFAVARPNPQ